MDTLLEVPLTLKRAKEQYSQLRPNNPLATAICPAISSIPPLHSVKERKKERKKEGRKEGKKHKPTLLPTPTGLSHSFGALRGINHPNTVTCFTVAAAPCPRSLPLLFSHSCRDRLVTSFLGNNRTVPALGRLSLRVRSQSPILTLTPQHPSLPEHKQLHYLPTYLPLLLLSLVTTTEKSSRGKGKFIRPMCQATLRFCFPLHNNTRSQLQGILAFNREA